MRIVFFDVGLQDVGQFQVSPFDTIFISTIVSIKITQGAKFCCARVRFQTLNFEFTHRS